jgi:hypothetical protein
VSARGWHKALAFPAAASIGAAGNAPNHTPKNMKIALNALRVASLAIAFTSLVHAGSISKNGGMFVMVPGANGKPTYATYFGEYHDNDSTSIKGIISYIYLSGGTMTGFDITVGVKNTTYTPLTNAVICAEFARGDHYLSNAFKQFSFTASNGSYRYVAKNNDTYIWRKNTLPVPTGYIVPTWGLGTIAAGGEKFVKMQISIPGGFPTNSTAATQISKLKTDKTDVLGNRSNAPQIPVYPINGVTTLLSNVSVFFR